MKIGVLGGTFDPIHYAHLIIAEYVRQELFLEKVLFIPASNPPHKLTQKLTPSSHRLAMTHLAIAGNEYFEVCDLEIRKKKISYSVDTVMDLRVRYNLAAGDIFFIIGSDSLHQLHTWRNPELLLKECTVVVVGRPGFSTKQCNEKFVNKIKLINMPLLDISASAIRDRVKRGKSIRYLTPQAVIQFITDQKLYTVEQ
jgi:nicotinate-nucleotide adenylyltransferase